MSGAGVGVGVGGTTMLGDQLELLLPPAGSVPLWLTDADRVRPPEAPARNCTLKLPPSPDGIELRVQLKLDPLPLQDQPAVG